MLVLRIEGFFASRILAVSFGFGSAASSPRLGRRQTLSAAIDEQNFLIMRYLISPHVHL